MKCVKFVSIQKYVFCHNIQRLPHNKKLKSVTRYHSDSTINLIVNSTLSSTISSTIAIVSATGYRLLPTVNCNEPILIYTSISYN